MAITFSNRIGDTRKKLARKLSERFPEYIFEPKDLWSQIPVYASAHWDCCSWGGTGYLRENRNLILQVHSWHKMREFVKSNIEIGIVGDIESIGTEICPVLKKQPLQKTAVSLRG